MDPPKSLEQEAKIALPAESHDTAQASSPSAATGDGPPTSGLRSSKSGWDGKLRVTDLASASAAPASDEEGDEGHESGAETDEETLVEPENQVATRTATVVNGPTIPGETIPPDEDLLKDYDDDAEDIDAVHCRISSLEALNLTRFTKLERLCLRQNEITDISSLPENLSTLEELDLYDNLIKHIKGLDNFPGLKSLDLSYNKIKHIKRVKHLKNLTDLYFIQNRITKIEELEGLDRVRNLELGGNQLREIENLETLVGLEQLWLGKNKITSLIGLPLLPNLTILSIQSNRITKLEALATNLPALEELYISHNLLTSLSGIEDCRKLRVIDISSNQISKLEGLESLEDLEEFWASNCLFDSFDDVEKQLKDKESLETVYFEGTPLQKRQPALYRNKVRLALPHIKQIDATYVRVG